MGRLVGHGSHLALLLDARLGDSDGDRSEVVLLRDKLLSRKQSLGSCRRRGLAGRAGARGGGTGGDLQDNIVRLGGGTPWLTTSCFNVLGREATHVVEALYGT